MSVYRHEKTPFYHYDFQYKGCRFHGTTGETTLAAAKRVEALERQKAVAAAAIEAVARAQGQRPSQRLTLAEVAAQYWDQVGARQKRSDQVLWSVNWLTDYFGDDKFVSEIDGAEISRMVAKRRGEKIINGAVARGAKRRKEKPKAAKEVSPARVNRSATEPLRKVTPFRPRHAWPANPTDQVGPISLERTRRAHPGDEGRAGGADPRPSAGEI
jgi:hypothetical protein